MHVHAHFLEPRASAKVGQVDHERAACDLCAHALNQFDARFGGAASGEQVVDHQNFFTSLQRVVVHFHHGLSVFEDIGLFDGFAGQLAFFTDRDEAFPQLVRNGATEDEAACLEADDFVDGLSGVGGQELVDSDPKATSVGEQSCHIAEHDPRVREIGDGADIVLDGFHKSSLEDAASDGVEFCDEGGIPSVGGGHDGMGQGGVAVGAASHGGHIGAEVDDQIAGFGAVCAQCFDDVADIDGPVVGVPAVVVGDHGDRCVVQFGFAREFGLWHIGHADHIATPRPVEVAFGDAGELRAFHGQIGAALVHGDACVLSCFQAGRREAGAGWVCHADVGHTAGAKE